MLKYGYTNMNIQKQTFDTVYHIIYALYPLYEMRSSAGLY